MKPILEIRNISKKFFIDHERPTYLSFRDRILDVFKERSKREEFWALNNVSFDVMAGDSIGIIGRNGAGKSTLLKILSRITPPTKGSIIARGRVASLLEVGTGFHQELTGRENIFMNGSILGMRNSEIKKKFDEIVDFSGVEKFLDTPLKHYSSGMQLRLAFAVAAHLEPEILIVDEVLAVGDAEFQKKCLGKMEEVNKSGRTILIVSHNMAAIKSLCSKAVVLQNGVVIQNSDNLSLLILEYLTSIEKSIEYKGTIVDHSFENEKSWDVNTFLNLKISWSDKKMDPNTAIDIACYTFDSIKVFAFQSDRIESIDFSKTNSVIFRIKNPGFPENALFFDVGFRHKNSGSYYILNQKCLSVIPGNRNLPKYSRTDVILNPKIEIEVC